MKRSNVRWTVVALIFFATTINYIDRQVIGLLKPYIQDDLGWSEADYGYIVTAFQVAYGVGMLVCGRMLDKFGSKLGYSIAIIVWSLGALLHATVRSVTGFGAARAILGLGEAGNFPAAVKVIAEWFPKRDRAYATGLFNSGTTIGAIIAPVIVTAITLQWGWRWAFVITGLFGFFWVVAWWFIYKAPEKNPKVRVFGPGVHLGGECLKGALSVGASCCVIARPTPLSSPALLPIGCGGSSCSGHPTS